MKAFLRIPLSLALALGAVISPPAVYAITPSAQMAPSSPTGGNESRSSVWTIRRGMSARLVRARLGRPQKVLAALSPGLGPCWIYPAEKPNTPIDYIYFCFDKHSRVAQIRYGIHA